MTTRPPLRQRKKIKTREAIIASAWKLFVSQGFDNTTLEQIADLADVHKQTVFRYFPSKQSIALAHNFELLGAFEQGIRDPERKGSVLDFWREYVQVSSSHFQARAAETRVVQEMIFETPTLRAQHLEIHRRMESLVVEALAKEGGRDPTTDLYAICLGAMLVAANRIVSLEVIRGELPKSLDQAELEVVDFIERTFPSRGAADAASPGPARKSAPRTGARAASKAASPKAASKSLRSAPS